MRTVIGPILTQLSGKRAKQEGCREDIRLFEKAENEKGNMHCWIIEVGIKAGLQRPLGEQQSDLGLGINWKIASGILGIPAHLFCAAHTVLHLDRLHRT